MSRTLAERLRIHARAKALLARKPDWDESKHPRDEDGRWTDAGGGDTDRSMDNWREVATELGLPVAEKNPAEQVYLRIGAWNPKYPRSQNYATGDTEAGLSVYELDVSGRPVVPAESEWAEEDLNSRLNGTEPSFSCRACW